MGGIKEGSFCRWKKGNKSGGSRVGCALGPQTAWSIFHCSNSLIVALEGDLLASIAVLWIHNGSDTMTKHSLTEMRQLWATAIEAGAGSHLERCLSGP